MQWSEFVAEWFGQLVLVLVGSGGWIYAAWKKRGPPPVVKGREQIIGEALAFVLQEFIDFRARYPDVHRLALVQVAADGELWGDAKHSARLWAEHYDGQLRALAETANARIECDADHVRVLRDIASGDTRTIITRELSDCTLKRIYAGGGVVQSDVQRVCNGTGLVFVAVHYTDIRERAPEYDLRLSAMAARIRDRIEYQ